MSEQANRKSKAAYYYFILLWESYTRYIKNN